MTRVTLSQAQINAGLHSGFQLGAGQFTFSVPTAASTWTDYAPGTQAATNYSILNAAQGAAFRSALSLWDALIAPNFTEVADNATSRGELRIAFTSFDMDPGTAAYAFLPTSQVPTSVVGDIWFNSNSVGQDFSQGTDHFLTLIHEIGHTLGLKHPFEGTLIPDPFQTGRYTAMSYTEAGRVVSFSTPMPGQISATRAPVAASTPLVLDIAAIQALYGADTTTASGNTTYAFSAADATVRAIYDAGGTDTWDLSGISRNNIVDLTPGAYSSIAQWTVAEQTAFYQAQFNPGFSAFIAGQLNQANTWTWTDNVGIALNTIIENVIGGSANDTITGNSADNFFTLTSGGTDIVSGEGGNDAFSFGAAWDATDRVDGGAGTNDQVAVAGNYTGLNAITFGAAQLSGVEVFAVLPGAGFGYTITTVDANVAAAQNLTIFGTNLTAGNALTFNGAAETDGSFTVYAGAGIDNVITGQGNDGIYFGPNNFNPSTDRVDGGAGANDQFALDGNYTLTLDGTAIRNAEVIVLLRGPDGDPASYNITIADSLVGAGQTQTIFALPVLTSVIVNGAAETDGILRIFGGTVGDTLTGGAQADRIFGGNGADALRGNAGADVFVYDAVVQSSGTAYDRIADFLSGTDKIDLVGTVTGIGATITGGALSAGSLNANLQAAFAGLGIGQAQLFKPNSGDLAGTTFLAVDANGIAGYQAGEDYLIQLDNNPLNLSVGDFI